MIKWDLLLCGPAFFELALDIDELKNNELADTPARDIIKRHSFTITNRLLECYADFCATYSTEELTEETCLAIGQGYVIDILDKRNNSKYNWIKDINDENDSINLLLKTLYENIEKNGGFPLVVLDSNSGFDHSKYRTVNFSGWLEKNITNLLTRNTIEFHYNAPRKDKAICYADWFKELFTGEKKLFIFDSYFLKNTTIKSFTKYYLPNMEPGTMVTIYCSTTFRSGNGNMVNVSENDINRFERILSSQASMYHIQLILIDASIEPQHDRFIYSEDFKLNIGVGLDYLNANMEMVRKNCQLDLIKYNKQELARLKKDYQEKPFFTTG